MHDTWDLVVRSMNREKRAGKCHTHIYKSIITPEKVLRYCYMNKRVLTGPRSCPNYEEAEAMILFMTELGYELQYDMSDGRLYRYDWNSKNELQERKQYSLEEAALFCRDITGEFLEDATDDGDEVEALLRINTLFKTWCARFTNVEKIYSQKK